MTTTPDSAALNAAQKLLRQFICLAPNATPPDPVLVRQALLLVVEHSDYQIFGICADSLTQAEAALKNYLNALDYEDEPEIPAIAGAVYVKYNPKSGRCHADSYTGEHRGVLVSCQSAYDQDVNETFGHLPLNLFGGG